MDNKKYKDIVEEMDEIHVDILYNYSINKQSYVVMKDIHGDVMCTKKQYINMVNAFEDGYIDVSDDKLIINTSYDRARVGCEFNSKMAVAYVVLY